MNNSDVSEKTRTSLSGKLTLPDGSINRAWLVFISYCSQLDHGEIERLKIQNGLPVLAEVIKEKIKFTS